MATLDYGRRFSSLERLYQLEGLQKLAKSHVVVAGIGGVGSWTVEALARSGVGELTLIDLDNVSESNINRQLPALSTTIGLPKIEVMGERIKAINPLCQTNLIEDYLTHENISHLIYHEGESPYWIIDAIDEVKVKAALISYAYRKKYKLITTGGAGGKTDPQQFKIADLNFSYHDKLCSRLKSLLKRDYGFPSKPNKMGVPVIFSTENTQEKSALGHLNCGGYGSVITLTATMGLMAAGFVINKIVAQKESVDKPSQNL